LLIVPRRLTRTLRDCSKHFCAFVLLLPDFFFIIIIFYWMLKYIRVKLPASPSPPPLAEILFIYMSRSDFIGSQRRKQTLLISRWHLYGEKNGIDFAISRADCFCSLSLCMCVQRGAIKTFSFHIIFLYLALSITANFHFPARCLSSLTYFLPTHTHKHTVPPFFVTYLIVKIKLDFPPRD